MTAVVPAHRCGAVPDSHRVPSCDASRLADGANQLHRPAYALPSTAWLPDGVVHVEPAARLTALDLDNASAATPIGMGCRVCERLDCPQRAAPPLGRPLRIDQNSSTFVPYPVAHRPE